MISCIKLLSEASSLFIKPVTLYLSKTLKWCTTNSRKVDEILFRYNYINERAIELNVKFKQGYYPWFTVLLLCFESVIYIKKRNVLNPCPVHSWVCTNDPKRVPVFNHQTSVQSLVKKGAIYEYLQVTTLKTCDWPLVNARKWPLICRSKTGACFGSFTARVDSWMETDWVWNIYGSASCIVTHTLCTREVFMMHARSSNVLVCREI